MITQKGTGQHKHTFRTAYKKDWGVPSNESYNKGERYILLRVCTTCPFKQAYDLTHDEPRTKVRP